MWRVLAVLTMALAWPTATAAAAPAADPPSLQDLIDATPRGGILEPPAGTYAGPVYVEKPITIDGRGQVTIDAGGRGTVVTLDTDGGVIKGLRLIRSGDSHNDIDAGVHIRGNYNVVKDNVIEDSLFGIDLQQANNNIVKRNRIIAKKASLGVRGDAVRLWYSAHNKITDNHVTDARDLVVWYSANNEIARNRVEGGRYGLHFMYSKYNLVAENSFAGNSVGIFLMYSDDVVVRRNRIHRALGATGMGIGLKETSNTEITDNEILYNGTGIYLDVSPFQPETTNRIYRNTLAFNNIGILFHNDWPGNLIRDNKFVNNIRQVSVNEYAPAARNTWDGNHWDDYEGFDRDGDGIGDLPHRPKVYADRIWMDVPSTSFFKGTPLLALVDLLERLAPFTEPLVLLGDGRPRVNAAFDPDTKPEDGAGASGENGEGAPKRLDPFGLGN